MLFSFKIFYRGKNVESGWSLCNKEATETRSMLLLIIKKATETWSMRRTYLNRDCCPRFCCPTTKISSLLAAAAVAAFGVGGV